ncbi:hypothetical protein D3C80_2148200 [compost metagenome]
MVDCLENPVGLSKLAPWQPTDRTAPLTIRLRQRRQTISASSSRIVLISASVR